MADLTADLQRMKRCLKAFSEIENLNVRTLCLGEINAAADEAMDGDAKTTLAVLPADA